ncbi:MAG: hypothetical protein WED04_13475 [Promethearchaeati archaeon SRVP18_Atabeyarchaeia-1]
METTTLETVALLPDGRPMLSFGTRGHDPALAGGLTSALYTFTREIDLRKTPADGLKIDVPGGGKLVLRRSTLSGREVLVSVIVRGVVGESILSLLSEFGRSLGEVLLSIKDWREISKGSFSSLYAQKAEIYLETLRRWRASTRMRPLVQIEFRDVVRSTLSVLGKSVKLSEPFLESVSNPGLSLSDDDLLAIVGKEIIILTSDQELFLALNAKDDQMKTALAVAIELRGMKPQALAEAQKTFEEVKNNFVQAIAGSINGETAFFRISERKEVWTNEIIRAVYRRMSKRAPHLILAHPTMGSVGDSKGLREMVSEFIETFLIENGPYGMMKKLLSNFNSDPALTRILTRIVEKCGPSFNESAACLFAILAGAQNLKDALAALAQTDPLAKSFETSLIETLSKGLSPKDSSDWVTLKDKVYRIIAETYAEILEEILIGGDLFVEKAKAVRDYLSGVLFTYQIITAINALGEHNWRITNTRIQIPTYSDLLSTGLSSQIVKKEDTTLTIDGEKHPETLMHKDILLMKRLWSNWPILSTALKEKMTSILKNDFYVPLQLFLQTYSQAVKGNLEKFGDFARSAGSGNALPALKLERPEVDRNIYEPIREDSERLYDLIGNFFEKTVAFINSTTEEISKAEGGRRVALAKRVVYTLEKIQRDYLLSPEENLRIQIDAALDKSLKRVDHEVALSREKVAPCFKAGPPFLKHAGGELEDPISAAKSYRPPPVEAFFQGGYKEILQAYSTAVLGLRVPDYMVRRAASQLKEKKQISPILKPLLKVKESNLDELVSMHLSEYVRIFTENAFSFASRHIDERYIASIGTETVTVALVRSEYVPDPAAYIGKPAGIEWNKKGDDWILRMMHPELPVAEQNSLQKVLDQQFSHIFQEKYGKSFELLIRIGNSLGPDEGKKVEESIQRLKASLLSSTT